VAKKPKNKPEPEPEWEEEPELIPTLPEDDEDILAIPEINEVKHNTFLRLAKPRTQKVLNSLKILGNCANKSSYAYFSHEIEKIFDTIGIALAETKTKFEEKIQDQKALFDF